MKDGVIKAVIFDLDDTMADRNASLACYSERFYQTFAARLAPTDAATLCARLTQLDKQGYRPKNEVFAGMVETLSWLSPPDVAEISAHWRSEFPRSAVAREGLYATLDALRSAGIRLGVLTNGSEQAQSQKIAHLKIEHYFSSVVISALVQCKKPDPRIFQHALAQIGCAAANTLFVGDHPVNDMQGAAGAGLIPVWFKGVHPWPQDQIPCARQISTLREVLQFVPNAA